MGSDENKTNLLLHLFLEGLVFSLVAAIIFAIMSRQMHFSWLYSDNIVYWSSLIMFGVISAILIYTLIQNNHGKIKKILITFFLILLPIICLFFPNVLYILFIALLTLSIYLIFKKKVEKYKKNTIILLLLVLLIFMSPQIINTYYEGQSNGYDYDDSFNLVVNQTNITITIPHAMSFEYDSDPGYINLTEEIQIAPVSSDYRWNFINNMNNDPDKRQFKPEGTGGTYVWENVYGWTHIFVWNETSEVGVSIGSKNRHTAMKMAKSVKFSNATC